MTIEEKKEYLHSYEKAKRRIKRIDMQISELRAGKIMPSVTQDGMPKGSGNNSDLSGYVSKLDELEGKYIRARYLQIKLCNEIMGKIEQLENENEKDVLVFRYIKLFKWERICDMMNVSWKTIHRIHSHALVNFMKDDTQ